VKADLRYLLEMVPPDMRDACALALEAGRARAERRELTGDQATRNEHQARPAARLEAAHIPVHPETPPAWYRQEMARAARGDRAPASRRGKRQLQAAMRVADGSVEQASAEAYRERKRRHFQTHARRFRYLRPQPRDGYAMPRAATAEQFIAARSAIMDEWGCRAAVVAMPAPIALRILAWVQSLPPCGLYGSPWASRLVRRTVATLCAILYAARPSWRDGYALVTTGMGRARLCEIIGLAPESGRSYSVHSLSHTEYGSLAILERIGVLERTQLPGYAVPACDRGGEYAFNHYLVPMGLVHALDGWGKVGVVNPTIPRDVAVEIAPWLAETEGQTRQLELVRAAALQRALEQLDQEHGAADGSVDLVDQVDAGAPLEGADPPDPQRR